MTQNLHGLRAQAAHAVTYATVPLMLAGPFATYDARILRSACSRGQTNDEPAALSCRTLCHVRCLHFAVHVKSRSLSLEPDQLGGPSATYDACS